MKYDLIVKDCSAEQARRIIDSAEGTVAEIATHFPAPTGNFTPPVPVPAVPAAPFADPNAGAAPADAVGGEAPASGIDVAGFPWDARIHSSNHKVTAKGVWVKRRGVDDATVAAVEAELRGGLQHQAGVTPQPLATAPAPFTHAAAPLPPFPAAPQPFTGAPIYTPNAAVPQPQAPAPQPMQQGQPYVPAPAAPVADEPVTFDGFMGKIQTLFQTGQINPAYLTELCGKLGVNSITDVNGQQNVINYAVSQMKIDGKWI